MITRSIMPKNVTTSAVESEISFRMHHLIHRNRVARYCCPLRNRRVSPRSKPRKGREGRVERSERSREAVPHGFTFGCHEFRETEHAVHEDAEADFDVGPAAHPGGVVGYVGVWAAHADDVEDYHYVGDTGARWRLGVRYFEVQRLFSCSTYRTPMAKSRTMGIFFLRGKRSLQTDLAGRMRIVISETMLNRQVNRTPVLLSRQ